MQKQQKQKQTVSGRDILDRLMKEPGLESRAALAVSLGIERNTLDQWWHKDRIDFPKVIFLCDQKNLDLNRIFLGRERAIAPPSSGAVMDVVAGTTPTGRIYTIDEVGDHLHLRRSVTIPSNPILALDQISEEIRMVRDVLNHDRERGKAGD